MLFLQLFPLDDFCDDSGQWAPTRGAATTTKESWTWPGAAQAGTGCHENEREEKIQACLANFKDIPFLESATSPEGIASFAESRDMQEMFVHNLLTFGKLTMRKLQGNWAELVHLLGK